MPKGPTAAVVTELDLFVTDGIVLVDDGTIPLSSKLARVSELYGTVSTLEIFPREQDLRSNQPTLSSASLQAFMSKH